LHIHLFNHKSNFHLELVPDLTTEEFLLCLKRYISRRGKPTQIILDNASQFKLAASFLDKIWRKNFTDENVLSYVHKTGCHFHFITELAPWMGGFYEKLISLVKRCLRKTLQSQSFTYTQLETIFTELEAVLNSRPLLYVASNELSISDSILTPAHFINFHGKNGTVALNQNNVCDVNDTRGFGASQTSTSSKILKLWKKGEHHLNMFWKIWKTNYLTSLRERKQTEIKQNKNCKNDDPKVGEVVQIKEEKLPRGFWRIGRIQELHQSKDGKVRSAKVMLHDKKTIVRPISLLFPIEIPT
jgi:hypothetical protein